MKALFLFATLGLIGCTEQLDWTLVENDKNGPFRIMNVDWNPTADGSSTWSATFKNTTGYIYSGERGVGLEFAVLSADGSVLETSEGFVPEAPAGRHTVAGSLRTGTKPVGVRLTFTD